MYTQLKLNFRRSDKNWLQSKNPHQLSIPDELNQSWSMHSMGDVLSQRQRLRNLNVIDDVSRQALAIEVDLRLPAPRVVRVLNRLVEVYGYPPQIRIGSSPDLVAVKLAEWAETHRVHLDFIKLGKPIQNSFVERFNRTYQEEVLDSYLFSSSDEVRRLTRNRFDQYNGQRPHQSVGRQTPLDYRAGHSRRRAKLLLELTSG